MYVLVCGWVLWQHTIHGAGIEEWRPIIGASSDGECWRLADRHADNMVANTRTVGGEAARTPVAPGATVVQTAVLGNSALHRLECWPDTVDPRK